MVTDSTDEEKKRPRKIAAPLVARLSASASSKAMIVRTGTIISVTWKVLPHRLVEHRVGAEAGVIVEADEMAVAERVGAVEAEQMPRISG